MLNCSRIEQWCYFTLCDVFISVGLAVSVTSLIARSIGSRHYKMHNNTLYVVYFGSYNFILISYFMFYKSEKFCI